ncbi:MAG: hypothetical protein ACTS6G_04640 [Candidatus Hodgkinia cicadicola]
MKLIQRSTAGSSYSRKLKRCGMIPAVLHFPGGWTVATAVASSQIRRMPFRQLRLFEVNGSRIPMLPIRWQLNPLTRTIQHIEYEVLNKRIMNCEVPLLCVNFADTVGNIKPFVSRRNVITNTSLVPNYVKLDLSSFVEDCTPVLNYISAVGLRSLFMNVIKRR